MKIESLAVDLLKTNLGTQMRAKVDDDTVEQYADLWKAKHDFPPLDVFYDGTDYVLADGFHRLYGAKAAKRASVPCHVHKGDVRDAILFACGANSDHGLHRSRADKRTAVEALLDDGEWGKRSQTWIAEQCKVSKSLVATVVADRKPSVLATPPESTRGNKDTYPKGVEPKRERVQGRDGKSYPATRPQESSPANASSPPPVSPADVLEGDCPKGGEHELDEDRVCMKCHAPDPAMEATRQEHNRQIESFARSIMAAFDAAPESPWLDESRLGIARDQVKSACATIRLAKAHDKPCPKCKGASCKTCRQCGFLPKTSYEAAGGQ